MMFLSSLWSKISNLSLTRCFPTDSNHFDDNPLQSDHISCLAVTSLGRVPLPSPRTVPKTWFSKRARWASSRRYLVFYSTPNRPRDIRPIASKYPPLANNPLVFQQSRPKAEKNFFGKKFGKLRIVSKNSKSGVFGKKEIFLANNPPLLINNRKQGGLFASNRSDGIGGSLVPAMRAEQPSLSFGRHSALYKGFTKLR